MKDSQSSDTTNMIPKCLGFTLLAVPHENFPAIIEAGLDGLIDCISSRFFQAGPTRPEVTITMAAEVGGL
jgi:hypothetical protein